MRACLVIARKLCTVNFVASCTKGKRAKHNYVYNLLLMHPSEANLANSNLHSFIYWSINHRCYDDAKYNVEYQRAFPQSLKQMYACARWDSIAVLIDGSLIDTNTFVQLLLQGFQQDIH